MVKLGKDVNEHKRVIKSDDPKSEIARHAKTGHKVNWKKPKIFDIESNYRSRLYENDHRVSPLKVETSLFK